MDGWVEDGRRMEDEEMEDGTDGGWRMEDEEMEDGTDGGWMDGWVEDG